MDLKYIGHSAFEIKLKENSIMVISGRNRHFAIVLPERVPFWLSSFLDR